MSTNKPLKRPPRTNTPDVEAEEAARRFGTRLREARGRRTLRDVAMESGVSIAYLSDLERANLKNPSLATLRKIAKALDVSIDDLLGDPSKDAGASTGPLPAGLADFVEGPVFGRALTDLAKRWSRPENELRAEWTRLLTNVEVGGRQPANEADWMFVFEAIRRAVDS